MRIDSAGNVGIGTNSPTPKFHVYTSVAGNTPQTNAGTTVLIENISVTGSAGLKLRSGASAYPNYLTYDVNSGSTATMVFYDQAAAAERMRIDSSGNVLLGTTSVGVAPTGYISAANQFAYKNFLINGGMLIWQRGTSSSTMNTYTTVDRWYMSGSNCTASRSSGPNSPNNNWNLNITSNATGAYVNPSQAVENWQVYMMRGKTVTFSFYVKMVTGTWGAGQYQPLVYYSSSSDAFNNSTGNLTPITGTYTAVTPSSSWQLAKASYVIPSDATGLTFMMNTSAGQASGLAWTLGDAQVELGLAVTSFDMRPYTTELSLCQRYYWQELNSLFASGIAFDTAEAHVRVQYPVPMRISPTVTIYDNSNNAARIHRNRVGDHGNAVTIVNATLHGFPGVSSSGLTSGGGYACKVKADAEL
jgi:hypothetical protein